MHSRAGLEITGFDPTGTPRIAPRLGLGRYGRHLAQCLTGVPRLPPQLQAELARDDAGADVARAAGDRAARMRRRARHVEPLDRRAVAEVVVHHLLGVERAHEDVAAAHLWKFRDIFAAGVDVLADDVLSRHVRRVARERLDD